MWEQDSDCHNKQADDEYCYNDGTYGVGSEAALLLPFVVQYEDANNYLTPYHFIIKNFYAIL